MHALNLFARTPAAETPRERLNLARVTAFETLRRRGANAGNVPISQIDVVAKALYEAERLVAETDNEYQIEADSRIIVVRKNGDLQTQLEKQVGIKAAVIFILRDILRRQLDVKAAEHAEQLAPAFVAELGGMSLPIHTLSEFRIREWLAANPVT